MIEIEIVQYRAKNHVNYILIDVIRTTFVFIKKKRLQRRTVIELVYLIHLNHITIDI